MPYPKPSPPIRPLAGAAHASLLILAASLGALAAGVRPQAEQGPSAGEELQAALAETDRLDPGWRPEDVQDRRPPLVDPDNSAVCVQEVCERLPPDWPDARLSRLEEMPPHLLREEEIDLVRSELAQAETAREEGQRLADLPRGYFSPALQSSSHQCVRICARLLEWQAWLQAQRQDAKGALLALRCMVHAGAAVDDEPHVLAQGARLATQNRACATLAVILAQTEPSDDELRRVEKVLRREQTHPLLPWMIRSERISCLTHLEEVERPPALRICNRALAIARLPVEVQGPLLEGLGAPAWRLPPGEQKLSRDIVLLGRSWLANRATLSCALVGLAVERYRLRHQRWPARLADLGPDLLPAVPADPFDGAPLRYRRLDDGIVIYSVGSDGKDDGGVLAPVPAAAPAGTDVGFRLWDPEHRRQKPAAPAPADVFG